MSNILKYYFFTILLILSQITFAFNDSAIALTGTNVRESLTIAGVSKVIILPFFKNVLLPTCICIKSLPFDAVTVLELLSYSILIPNSLKIALIGTIVLPFIICG